MQARSRFWWILAAVSAVLTVCVGWLTFDHLFMPFAGTGQSVEIPNFCGATYESLSPADWMAVEVEYRYDEHAASGTVLSQSPAAGTRKKLTDEEPRVPILLTVSRGKEMLILPDMVGRDVREAESLLRGMGLVVRTAYVQSTYPNGRVLSCDPPAETPVPKGRETLLTVSSGAPNAVTTVPDLRGLSREDALIRLWLAQLTVGDVVEEFSAEPDGCVVRQSHQPGTRVKVSTKITIYISGGE